MKLTYLNAVGLYITNRVTKPAITEKEYRPAQLYGHSIKGAAINLDRTIGLKLPRELA